MGGSQSRRESLPCATIAAPVACRRPHAGLCLKQAACQACRLGKFDKWATGEFLWQHSEALCLCTQWQCLCTRRHP